MGHPGADTKEGFLAPRLLQGIMGAFTAAGTALIGAKLFSRRAAWMAGLWAQAPIRPVATQSTSWTASPARAAVVARLYVNSSRFMRLILPSPSCSRV